MTLGCVEITDKKNSPVMSEVTKAILMQYANGNKRVY